MKNYRIKDLREDNDLTQQKIAKILRISQRTYSHYEVGDRNIPIEVFIELSEFYNTSVDYILGLTNETRPYKRK